MVETFYRINGAPSVALIGDFHNGDPTPIIASLTRRRPSLICIPGDLVYWYIPETELFTESQQNVLPLLSACVSLAPTFLSPGNHESILYDEDWALIRSTGVTVLDNAWTRITVDGKEIAVGGLTSHRVINRRAFRAFQRSSGLQDNAKEHWTRIRKPDLSWIEPVPEGFSILLSHHPEYFPSLPFINLVLSCHAHGGQWRFFRRGLYAPGQGWFPKYTKGVYEKRLVVSAGLKNTASTPRLFNPTEIVYINTNCECQSGKSESSPEQPVHDT